jgi:hypothetical protein
MKKKKIILIALSLLLIYGVHSFISKIEKDKWVNEPPFIKYSEKKENEVWGVTLRGFNPIARIYPIARMCSNYSRQRIAQICTRTK